MGCGRTTARSGYELDAPASEFRWGSWLGLAHRARLRRCLPRNCAAVLGTLETRHALAGRRRLADCDVDDAGPDHADGRVSTSGPCRPPRGPWWSGRLRSVSPATAFSEGICQARVGNAGGRSVSTGPATARAPVPPANEYETASRVPSYLPSGEHGTGTRGDRLKSARTPWKLGPSSIACVPSTPWSGDRVP